MRSCGSKMVYGGIWRAASGKSAIIELLDSLSLLFNKLYYMRILTPKHFRDLIIICIATKVNRALLTSTRGTATATAGCYSTHARTHLYIHLMEFKMSFMFFPLFLCHRCLSYVCRVFASPSNRYKHFHLTQ